MIQKDVLKANRGNEMIPRYALRQAKEIMDSGILESGKILTLFGLRRTGKTTVMEQLAEDYGCSGKCAFYEVTDKDTMDDIKEVLIKEQENGTDVIFLDEITKAEDFITSSSILPDIFSKEGMRIVVAGNDTLGFVLAEDRELYDRTKRIRMTYIPFAEHCEVLGTGDIDDYIMYGGLMRKSLSEIQVHDYESAKKYLDSAVSENISSSIKKDPHDSDLDKLSRNEIRSVIEKMVEIYSGVFNKNAITRDFVKTINADLKISKEVTDEMVTDLERYLIDMDLLSVTERKHFSYTDETGWMEGKTEKEYYIVQPAIKYHHLQKGKEFIENEPYYNNMSGELKELMEENLDEYIKGLMVEQIIVFDVSRSLPKQLYSVSKAEFYINGQKKGEYDMFIYEKKTNKCWAFEIKHTKKPFIEQAKHLRNKELKDIIEKKYGKMKGACILYRGESFVSPTDGTVYLNITDFMKQLNKSRDMDKTFEVLTENLKEQDIEREYTPKEKDVTT